MAKSNIFAGLEKQITDEAEARVRAEIVKEVSSKLMDIERSLGEIHRLISGAKKGRVGRPAKNGRKKKATKRKTATGTRVRMSPEQKASIEKVTKKTAATKSRLMDDIMKAVLADSAFSNKSKRPQEQTLKSEVKKHVKRDKKVKGGPKNAHWIAK